MMNVRFNAAIKRTTAGALYYSGLLWVYAIIRLRRCAVVLMYHRVLPSDADTFSHGGIIVRPQTFERQMSFLRRFFRPISVEQLAGYLERREPPPSMSCVVTFDDGWVDNFEHALPSLVRARIPATVFLATDFIGADGCFWQERLARRLFEAALQGGTARTLVQSLMTRTIDLLEAGGLRNEIRAVVAGLKNRSAADVSRIVAELNELLAAESDGGTGVDRFMSWEQTAKLVRQSDASIGAHGCSHIPLTVLPKDMVADELRGCRERIAVATGQAVVAVAYPNGDFNDTVVQEVRRAGYRLGFTTRRGLVSASDDRFKLRRINIHESATATMPEFLCTLLGVFRRYQPADLDARSGN